MFARLISFVRRRPLVSGLGATAVIGLGLYLVFGYFAFHLLFVDETVDEASPFEPTVAAVEPATTTVLTTIDSGEESAATTTSTTTTTQLPEPTIEVVASGEFIDREHPTMGTASIITDGDRHFLRFEGFETDNGPDLNVYLATGPPDGSPGSFVDLGDLKGNVGDQNYEIPPDVELSEYPSVFIWCVRFSVAFGAAAIN